MTEVASLNAGNLAIAVERRYEAGPPEGLQIVERRRPPLNNTMMQPAFYYNKHDDVEPGDTFATTKEEEWVSKKTTEVTNTKQIETRIKRQVVLEDGKVVEDSGPMVTTNTTEDTETQEHHQTELRKLGDEDENSKKALEAGETPPENKEDRKNWVAVPNPDGVVREVKERRVLSREETEDTRETEDVQHLGDITDEAFIAAVGTGKTDIRKTLRTHDAGQTVVSTGPRLVKETHRSNKVIDTEDTRELSSVRPDGRIVTETQRTTEHEEIKDDELPEGAPEQNDHRESHQRFFKSREQEEVDYIADGVKVGHEMRFRAETTEGEKRGDGIDEPDWDSLSARAKRRHNLNSNRQAHKLKDTAIPSASPLDRKDALTKKPLDFDQEEETRKLETSKWLEHHFGSESRSSRDSLDDIDDEEIKDNHPQPPRTSFFNVTIKSQPTQHQQSSEYHTTSSKIQHLDYSPAQSPPENDYHTRQTRYFQGISEWTEREKEVYSKTSPGLVRSSPTPYAVQERYRSSPPRDYRNSPPKDYIKNSPPRDYRNSPPRDYRGSPTRNYRNSPQRDYRKSPSRDYRGSPHREVVSTPPERRRVQERPQRLGYDDDNRVDSGYRTPSRNELRDEPVEEPPPDYSPTSPPRASTPNKKAHQKTRFATETTSPPPPPPPQPKQKSGNIIGQSIRKLVGKIRSASAERKARQQQQRAAKRSPSPSYKPGHVIDNINDQPPNGVHHGMENGGSRRSGSPGPVHRYYLGEDPFGGSIYGKENKYDGVRPARPSRRHERYTRDEQEEYRSHSTLGRFSKSSSRVDITSPVSQTLPRHSSSRNERPNRLENGDRSNNTINVSFINTVSTPNNKPILNGGPAKPARTFRSNLSRSKSFNVDLDSPRIGMNRPQIAATSGLKSPGLISSISRSQRDLTVDQVDDGRDFKSTSRFARNGLSDNKRVFMKDLRQRAPELYKTLHEEDKEETWRSSNSYNSPFRSSHHKNKFNGDIYEPPTRLRDTYNGNTSFKETYAPTTSPAARSVIRRGSNSSNDYSETYHTTTRNDDPVRPSVTNTVQSFSKKTVPTKDGRSYQTIESTETKSITKSRYSGSSPLRHYEYDRKINGSAVRGGPVVIEVRNNYK